MANRVEIFVEVDPNGKGAAGIKSITAQVDNLGSKSKQAGATGREALDGFAGGLGVPTSIAAATTAIGAGILAIGVASVKASNQASTNLRILKSDAQEAGVALEEARKDAKRFGDDLAISASDAEKTYAQFLRVLKTGGEVKNADKIQEDITDLLAAYGIAGKEAEILFGQILSGQDEALNRLGLADPSKIYEAYAKKIGKAVDALSQEEKARSIIVALQEKGARFEGAAEERLASQAGQWAMLQKRITDTTVALGDFLQKQTIIGEIPFILQNPFNLVEAKARQLEAENERKIQEARRKALADSDAYFKRQNQSLGVPQALNNPFGSFQNLTTMVGEEQAKKIREGFVAQYETLFKDKRLDKITALFAERQFREIRGILDPKKAAEIEAQFNQFWDKFAKVALGALKTARDASGKFFDSVAERQAGGQNPFVKVIQDANDKAEQLRKTFGLLGDSAVRDLQKIEDSFTKQKILALELDAQLKASALNREANNLANPVGLSGRQDRLLGELDARIRAAVDAPGLLAVADALGAARIKTETEGKGRDAKTRILGLDINQDNVGREQIDNLRDLQNFGFREGREFGQKARAALNQATVNLFNSLSPELQASIAKGQEGYAIKAAFIDAFKGAAENLQEQVKEEIAKQGVADKAIAGVREDIAIINRLREQGLSTQEADTRLLAVTGALAPNELTADVRQARIEALRREAERNLRLQEDAIKATDEAKKSTDKLTASIDKLAGEIRKPENRKLLIEINNKAKANVRDELYGSLQED